MLYCTRRRDDGRVETAFTDFVSDVESHDNELIFLINSTYEPATADGSGMLSSFPLFTSAVDQVSLLLSASRHPAPEETTFINVGEMSCRLYSLFTLTLLQNNGRQTFFK